MSHTPPGYSRYRHTPDEDYTFGGLLAYVAAVPGFVALLAAPGLMLMFVLGALTAVLLNKAFGLI